MTTGPPGNKENMELGFFNNFNSLFFVLPQIPVECSGLIRDVSVGWIRDVSGLTLRTSHALTSTSTLREEDCVCSAVLKCCMTLG